VRANDDQAEAWIEVLHSMRRNRGCVGDGERLAACSIGMPTKAPCMGNSYERGKEGRARAQHRKWRTWHL
jgi:hypothetical protein